MMKPLAIVGESGTRGHHVAHHGVARILRQLWE